ncbi:hypothetical protein BH10ACT11_BH10ACT11_13610 [soil metagenome]
MESTARRTLVKSAPELWELADDLERMEAWLCDVAGGPVPGVEVTEREHQQRLAWQNADTAIALELAEGTFGTAVRIRANHEAVDPNGAKAALERLLDELGSPERRPFTRA